MSDYEVLTDQQMADELQVSKETVQRMCRSREIRAFKVGTKLWRISRADFEAWKLKAAS